MAMATGARTNPLRRKPATVMLVAGTALLASCNESSSENVTSARLVLHGDLVAGNSTAKLKASLGREGSSVVVVLEGGDALHGSDSLATQRMEYVADLFGSYYRTAFPLDNTRNYSVTLLRAADGSRAQSFFPPLPTAFTITAPLPASSVSLTASPFVALAWDSAVAAQEFAADTGIACDWRIVPGPDGLASAIVRESSGRYEILTSVERAQRRRDVPVKAYVDEQRAGLGIDYPWAGATLLGCDATFSLYAKNRGEAAPGLSPYSEMTSRRTAESTIRLTP